jgi:tetratricopeptide (TPR) repeat protein
MDTKAQQFQAWLQKGHDSAWAGNWAEAANAYRQAIGFQGNDPLAHISLGLALYEQGDLNAALTAYQRALALNPNEVPALQKLAEIYAQQGDSRQASAFFMRVADGYMKLRQPAQAVRAWQQVVRHDPTNRVAYRRLADAYQRGRRNDLAAQALLGLARVHSEANERKTAVTLAREALTLKPDYTPAQHFLSLVDTPAGTQFATAATPRPTGLLRSAPPPSMGLLNLAEEESHNRIASTTQLAQERALARLADSFFAGEGGDLEVEALKAQALDLQTRGLTDEAIRTYEQVIKRGGGSDDIYYTLGTLYQSLFRPDEAIKMYQQVMDAPDYATAAHFAIGQCYQNTGRMDEALTAFLEAAKKIDLQSVEKGQADEIIKLYEGLADSYDAKGDKEQAEHFLAQLTEFLSQRGWEDKLRELQARLGNDTNDLTIAEFIENAANPEVFAALEAAGQYQEHGLYRAAIEELYWGMDAAPYYLPLHTQMAELFLLLGKMEEAVAKMVMVADAAHTRGKPTQAIRALERAVEMNPIDQNVRSRLIDLLMSNGAVDVAMHHYVQLAEGFYQLAQVDRAVEKLNEALRVAPRANPEAEWNLKIQRRLADIHTQRLDGRRAVAALEGIYQARPMEIETVQQLTSLYFRLGAEERALNVIEDTTNRLLHTEGQTTAYRFLQHEVTQQATNPTVVKLFGTFQSEWGESDGAARSWEKAVELFVRKGDKAQAGALLRRIIALRTTNEARYRAMLEHLMKVE